MAALYQLEIVTPMGRKFEGLVDNCVFRSTEGDVGILKGHSPYVAAIETGEIKIHTENGQTRYAAASEGFVHVSSELVRILVSSCDRPRSGQGGKGSCPCKGSRSQDS